jgi:uncharacterized protein (DUF2062 family)
MGQAVMSHPIANLGEHRVARSTCVCQLAGLTQPLLLGCALGALYAGLLFASQED